MAARCQRGLTMVEVLVAIVVLAIGLLGLAGLQLNGLKVSRGSAYRWKATELAADMADQLRANKGSLGAAPGPCLVTPAGTMNGACPTTGLLSTSLPAWGQLQLSALPGANASYELNANGAWQVDIAWDDAPATQIGAGAPAPATTICGSIGSPSTACFNLFTQIL